MEGKLEGKIEGRLEGRLEGKIEGRMEEKVEIVREMLIEGDSIDKIARITKLSVAEVEKSQKIYPTRLVSFKKSIRT